MKTEFPNKELQSEQSGHVLDPGRSVWKICKLAHVRTTCTPNMELLFDLDMFD